MEIMAAQPAPAHCTRWDWCVADHDEGGPVREHTSAGRLIASFPDTSLTVGVVQVTFLAPGLVDTTPAVRLGKDDISTREARRLAAELLAAADFADLVGAA